MKIIQEIKDSIYNPDFYQREKDGSIKNALSYFSKITLIQSLIITLVFSLFFIPFILKILSPVSTNKFVGYFPEELTVTFKNGQASTNVAEPYFIPFSKATIDLVNSKPELYKDFPLSENALIIDTKSPINLDLINTNKTSVLLTKESLVVKDSRGKITIQPLKTFPNMEINRTKINGWINSARPYFKFVIPIVTILSFIFIFGVSVFTNLVMITIMSLIIWIVLKLQKRSLFLKQIFKLGLYCITSVIILNIILSISGVGPLWYLSIILFLIIFFINIKDKKVITTTVKSQDPL